MKVTLVLCGVAVVAAVCTGAAKARLLLVGTVSAPAASAVQPPVSSSPATALSAAPQQADALRSDPLQAGLLLADPQPVTQQR